MPITQDRMLKLLDAAKDYKRGFEQTALFIERQREHVAQGKITLQEGWELISNNIRAEFMLGNALESAMTIILESKHFQANRVNNIRKAERLKENRLLTAKGEPIPDRRRKRRTAPRSIVEVDEPSHTPLISTGVLAYKPDFSDDDDLLLGLQTDGPQEPPPETKKAIDQFLEQKAAEEEYNNLGKEKTDGK